jgi:hypothetical protein
MGQISVLLIFKIFKKNRKIKYDCQLWLLLVITLVSLSLSLSIPLCLSVSLFFLFSSHTHFSFQLAPPSYLFNGASLLLIHLNYTTLTTRFVFL